MKLELKRPLVIFDLEATGLKISEARIIAIGAIKIGLQGEVVDQFEALVNPLCEISDEILQLTGLKQEEITLSSPFANVGARLIQFMQGCDLGGFNVTRFDLPLLAEECARIGVDFPDPDTKIVDSQVIYHTYNPRTLTAALSHYCHKDHSAAHDAMGDTIATVEVLEKQLETHDLPKDIDGLHDYSMRGKGLADWTRLFYYDDQQQLRYNFGKHKDQKVFGSYDTENYLDWMMGRDFPMATKNFIRKLQIEHGIVSDDDDYLVF